MAEVKKMEKRTSVIRRAVNKAAIKGKSEYAGPDTMYVVDLWEGDRLVEQRELPGKSSYYAREVSENWNNGLIKISE